MKIEKFVKLMIGYFDNKEQFTAMKEAGKIYPYAQHVNTVCNDKIKNIPEDFAGVFIVEESYYETDGKRHASPHLFLITESCDGILLSSYELPAGEDKNTFSYASMKIVDYNELKKSEKFTPALYKETDGGWEGGSVSHFSTVMTLRLYTKGYQLNNKHIWVKFFNWRVRVFLIFCTYIYRIILTNTTSVKEDTL